ncbi:hypothetical protein ACL02U_27050 [Streptomyces sp. MS06]|uniref:hypothetical protein n=1 Tax=Streptomyces sp. MS06 TaxID=3385974 RepID=UPI0039A01981
MKLSFRQHSCRPSGRRLSAIAGTLAVTGLLAWLTVTLLAGPHIPKVVASNVSQNFRACLINDQRDATMAQPVWSALQQSASGSDVNAQRIEVPQSDQSASLPYVNSLVQRKCGLIIAVGPNLHSAVVSAARHNPHQNFISIGTPISLPNVRSYSATELSTVISAIRQAASPPPSQGP